jgi:hypothetical protein
MPRAISSLLTWLEVRYFTGRPRASASASDASFSLPLTRSTCEPKSFRNTWFAQR